MSEWQRYGCQPCVECPDCGFTFADDHEDDEGGYSCPACGERDLKTALSSLIAELRDHGYPYAVPVSHLTAYADRAEQRLREVRGDEAEAAWHDIGGTTDE